jgi:hypothetical protein
MAGPCGITGADLSKLLSLKIMFGMAFVVCVLVLVLCSIEIYTSARTSVPHCRALRTERDRHFRG